jgi:hypothetical protein
MTYLTVRGWCVCSVPQVAALLEPAPCDPGEHPMMFPLHKMRAWKQGPEFLHNCRIGVLQFVFISCLNALLGFLGHGDFLGLHHVWETYGTVLFELILKNLSQV